MPHISSSSDAVHVSCGDNRLDDEIWSYTQHCAYLATTDRSFLVRDFWETRFGELKQEFLDGKEKLIVQCVESKVCCAIEYFPIDNRIEVTPRAEHHDELVQMLAKKLDRLTTMDYSLR